MQLLSLYLSLEGRITRLTFWYAATLLAGAFTIAFVAIEAAVGRPATLALYPLLYWGVFALVAKRYHDMGRVPARVLLVAIPILGPLQVASELCFHRGTGGDNRYGADPLAEDVDYHVVA